MPTRTLSAQAPIALVPVLEVEPYRYSDTPMPGADRTAQDWANYFQRCMADAGFRDVVPVGLQSNFVAARTLIGNPILERMIREAGSDSIDEISPLSGGLALTAASELLFQPSCCGDLSNVQEWSSALDLAPAAASMWIGHPMLEIEFTGEHVVLRETQEYPNPSRTLLEASMPVAWLRDALQAAQVEQARFRDELVPMVSRIVDAPDLALSLANRLSGLG